MTLYEEIYFEIIFSGEKSELKKMVKFLKSGELDDFFEITSDFICYADEYKDSDDEAQTEFTLTNDDLGIEVDEFDTDEFLEIICKAGRKLDIRGNIYDSSDEEYSFVSEMGDSYYINANGAKKFNDELDEAAENEEMDEEE
jgi:hypothetical protein